MAFLEFVEGDLPEKFKRDAATLKAMLATVADGNGIAS